MVQQQLRDAELERIIAQANKEQLLIIKVFSRLVGRVLAEVEIAELEENRYKQLRRVINAIIYNNSRNPLLRFFTEKVEPDVVDQKITQIFSYMSDSISQRLSLAFPDAEQKSAIKKSVQTVIEDTRADLHAYFNKRREKLARNGENIL